MKMVDIKYFLIVLASAIFVSNAAQAGGAALDVTVTGLTPIESGAFIAYISATITGGPSCATQTTRIAADPNTAGGRAVIAVLMMSYATGKTFDFTGNGTCNVWGDTETVQWLNTH
jgi:hypothetical protein